MWQVLLGVVIGVSATEVSAVVDALKQPPSREERMEDIYRAAARAGLRVSHRWSGRLHDADSIVLVLQGTRLDPDTKDPGIADELRIYDIREDALRLRLRFSPQRPAGRFRMVEASDLDSDGRRDLLITFEDVPLLVRWSASGERYEMLPVIGEAPFPRGPASSSFNIRSVLKDRFSSRVVWGYPATAVSVVGREPPVIVAGFPLEVRVRRTPASSPGGPPLYCGPTLVVEEGLLRTPCGAKGAGAPRLDPTALDIQAWRFIAQGDIVTAVACNSRPMRLELNGGSPESAVARGGRELVANRACS